MPKKRETKQFIFDIDAVSKARPRYSSKSKRFYTKSATRDFENTIHRQTLDQMEIPPFQGALSVSVDIHLRRPKTVRRKYPQIKPDLDNFLKSIFDGMNKAAWNDDAQICTITASKYYADSGRIIVKVSELK